MTGVMAEGKDIGHKKKYRFFFHYRKLTSSLTIHFRSKCIPVQNVICRVPCESKWHARQPHLTMQGFAHDVELVEDADGKVLGIIQ